MYTSRLEDKMAISDLMTAWMHRDLGNWDKLREVAHADGTIEITWYKGLFSGFVDGSAKMGESSFLTKHIITNPVIEFNGNKAVVETNAMIIGENPELDLGCTGHNRFIDQVEKRDGIWRIVSRNSVYDMCHFTFPVGMAEIDQDIVKKYPREYAALAYILEKSGFPVKGKFATKGSSLELEIKKNAMNWLNKDK